MQPWRSTPMPRRQTRAVATFVATRGRVPARNRGASTCGALATTVAVSCCRPPRAGAFRSPRCVASTGPVNSTGKPAHPKGLRATSARAVPLANANAWRVSMSTLRRNLARIWRRLRGERQSPARVALAVALGLFIGCLPVYGLHFVLCLLVCLPFGLDLVLAYLVANISNPLVAPFLITLEVEIGSLVSTGRHAGFSLERARQTGILGFAFQAALGSIFVGAGLGALGSAIAYLIARKRRASAAATATSESDAEDEIDAAMQRTIQRYRTAAT